MKAVNMLDTVAINLMRHEFTINAPDRFSPSAAFISNPLYTGRTIMKSYYNPTKADKEYGYLPRLTLFKKPFGNYSNSVWLKVEFSAPKMKFGNNFEELYGKDDFDYTVQQLFNALKYMGIDTTIDALKGAKVAAIHYSKNLLLERHTPCYLLIQTLEKIDLSTKMDLNQTDFRNGGQMAKYHAGTFEIAIYDKVKDLEQGLKYGSRRGVENDYACQANLFQTQRKPEVLRLEVRLKSRKFKTLFNQLGFKVMNTFKDLFCPNLSRAVLLHYWDFITKGLYMLHIDASSSERLIDNIRTHYPKKRINSVLALMGFIQTCQDIGIRGARLHLNLSDQQFYRLKADAKKLDQNLKCPRFIALNSIKNQLKEFIPLIKEDIVITNLIETKM